MTPLLPRDFPKPRNPYPWRQVVPTGLIMVAMIVLDALTGR